MMSLYCHSLTPSPTGIFHHANPDPSQIILILIRIINNKGSHAAQQTKLFNPEKAAPTLFPQTN